MTHIDVTSKVIFGDVDAESIPLMKCVCGAVWPIWDGPIMSSEESHCYSCPYCKRLFVVSIDIHVYEVQR